MAQRLLAMVFKAGVEELFEVELTAASSLRLAGYGYTMSALERVDG